jgi:hypothetical protein
LRKNPRPESDPTPRIFIFFLCNIDDFLMRFPLAL